MVEECGDDWKNNGVGVPRSKAVYTDAVGAGTVKGFARKASARVQRIAGGNTGSSESAELVGAVWMEGNQLGIGKRQDTLVENRRKQWEQPM